MPANRLERGLIKPLATIAVPGMYLVYKYNQFKRQQQETSRRKVTEKELQSLNQKIVSTRSLVRTRARASVRSPVRRRLRPFFGFGRLSSARPVPVGRHVTGCRLVIR